METAVPQFTSSSAAAELVNDNLTACNLQQCSAERAICALQSHSYLWFLKKTGCCMCHKRQPHVVQLAPERQPLTESLHSSCLLLGAAPTNAPCALKIILCTYQSLVLAVILVSARGCKCKHQASQEQCQQRNEPTQLVLSRV